MQTLKGMNMQISWLKRQHRKRKSTGSERAQEAKEHRKQKSTGSERAQEAKEHRKQKSTGSERAQEAKEHRKQKRRRICHQLWICKMAGDDGKLGKRQTFVQIQTKSRVQIQKQVSIFVWRENHFTA